MSALVGIGPLAVAQVRGLHRARVSAAAHRLLDASEKGAAMSKALSLVACCAFAFGGCSNDNDDTVFFVNTATMSIDAVTVANGVDAFVFFGTDSLDAVFIPGTPNRAAAAAAATAASVNKFFSASCATAVANGAVVTLTLNNCTGPLGMVAATGTVTLAYEDLGDGNGLKLTLTSNQMTANGTSLTIMETATINSVNGTRTATIHSGSSGIDANGAVVQLAGDSTLTWTAGSTCATLNGTFATNSTSTGQISSAVSDLVRCAGACPTGTIVSTGGSRTVTVTLDGKSTASFVGSSGFTGTVLLSSCQ
jgi:hypothetical protein